MKTVNATIESILKQLGGRKFVVMTGARNFMSLGNALCFSLPKSKHGINKVKIDINENDLYDITFYKLGGAELKTIHEAKNIYVDNLRDVIAYKTGLALSLEQEGTCA